MENNVTDINELKYYTETVHLPSGAWVEIRGMKTREMDILANKKAMKDGEGINEIAKNCIVNSSENFNYDTALQGDRYSIIVNLRRITYPGMYEFQVQCPECGSKSSYKVDLNEMEMKMLDGRPTTGLEFEFPRCKKKIKYHLPTGIDEKEIIKMRKKYPENLLSMALMVYTDEIEGERMKKLEFFQNLDAYDVLAFQDDLSERNCGIETGVNIECSNCDNEFEVEMPITKDFFLPKKAKKR